jgi:hypothetical protein
MSGPTPPKDETEIPTFVRTVLKEQEKELGQLICKLSEATEKLREPHEIVRRIDKAKEKLETLRKEISIILKCRFDEK